MFLPVKNLSHAESASKMARKGTFKSSLDFHILYLSDLEVLTLLGTEIEESGVGRERKSRNAVSHLHALFFNQ